MQPVSIICVNTIPPCGFRATVSTPKMLTKRRNAPLIQDVLECV
jgi:hypothetical protein